VYQKIISQEAIPKKKHQRECLVGYSYFIRVFWIYE